MRLKNKIAIISGGANGIGAAHARVFSREGAKVVVGDVQGELGQQVVDGIVREGGEAVFVLLDVTREADWANAIRTTVDRFGGLTTLVNNAGLFRPEGVESTTVEIWERIIAVNQKGIWLGMKAAMPELKKSGNGAIVNLSSIYGIVGSPGAIAYHATKGAVRLMSKAAALEYARLGVRVNSVHPGVINTTMLGDVPADALKALEGMIPVGKFGEPEDVAYASVFLCSDEARYATGSELVIDGGMTAF